MLRSIASVAAMVGLAACNTSGAAPGPAADQMSAAADASGQRSFDVGRFDHVRLAGPHDVIVTVGGPSAVRAEGDAAALERLVVRVEDGRLVIDTRRGWSGQSGRVTVHVTAPSLQAAEIAGSGNMRVGALRTARFSGSVAGSGNLLLDRIEADAADFDISGSGDVRASGRVRQAALGIAGSGNVDLAELESETANVSIAGSGNARLRASRTAAVSVMGSGDVTIDGGARCTVSRMGSGSVRCDG